MKARWVVALLGVVLLAMALLGVWKSPPVKAQALQLPCRDARGCPDLIVDQAKLNQWHVDFIDFSSSDCAVVEGCVDGPGPRLLLRFTSNTPNIGAGDLIIGDPTAPENQGFFEPSGCHRHLHFKEYADYRLWTPTGYQKWQQLRAGNPGALAKDLLTAHPEIAKEMVAGRKMGFCVIDLLPYNTPGAANLRPGVPKYVSCRSNQGISNGYADEYIFLLDCQWIDTTNVKPGKYILEDEVNPERLFQESDYSNNAAAIEVNVPDRTGRGPRARLKLKKFVPYEGGCGSCSTEPVPALR